MSAASIQKAREGILQVMADWHSVNVDTMKLLAVAESAGYKGVEGKAFRTAIKELKDQGNIQKSKDEITITAEGIKILPKPKGTPAKPTNESTQAKILEMLIKDRKGLPSEEKITKVFNKMLDGKAHSKKNLAHVAGYAGTDSKPFVNLMRKMKVYFQGEGKGGIVQFSESKVFPFGPPGVVAAKSSPPAEKNSDGDKKKKTSVDKKRKAPTEGVDDEGKKHEKAVLDKKRTKLDTKASTKKTSPGKTEFGRGRKTLTSNFSSTISK